MGNLFGGGGGDIDMPSVTAEQAKRTAEPTEQLTAEAKRNRKLAASLLTSAWAPPKLGTPGLLGIQG